MENWFNGKKFLNRERERESGRECVCVRERELERERERKWIQKMFSNHEILSLCQLGGVCSFPEWTIPEYSFPYSYLKDNEIEFS
jgi:hypothetical protein